MAYTGSMSVYGACKSMVNLEGGKDEFQHGCSDTCHGKQDSTIQALFTPVLHDVPSAMAYIALKEDCCLCPIGFVFSRRESSGHARCMCTISTEAGAGRVGPPHTPRLAETLVRNALCLASFFRVRRYQRTASIFVLIPTFHDLFEEGRRANSASNIA